MADPNTWLALQYIQSQLATIQVANGFYTDAGLSVQLEPQQVNADAPLIMVLVATGYSSQKVPGQSWFQRKLDFTIEASITTQLDTAQYQAHLLLADIETACLPLLRNVPYGQSMSSIELLDRTIEIRPEGVNAIVVKVNGQTTIYQPH